MHASRSKAGDPAGGRTAGAVEGAPKGKKRYGRPLKPAFANSPTVVTKIPAYIPNRGSWLRTPLASVRGRTWLSEALPFEIFQVFLRGGVAEVNSAAIPGRGPRGVARSTANTSPAEETGVESRPQP